MNKVFVINCGQKFGMSEGRYNQTIADTTVDFFKNKGGYDVRLTNVSEEYDSAQEVANFLWADFVIYHTPMWWFGLPFGFKTYIDSVFLVGYGNGMYSGDGRSSENPGVNYGRGGLLQGRKYLVTTTWNAPKEAFTTKGEFFELTSVDQGPLFGFHCTNKFIGMDALEGFHFYDVVKNNNIDNDLSSYRAHLAQLFNN